MKKIILIFLLIFWKFFAQAQPAAEDSVDYIYIGVEEDTKANVQTMYPPTLPPEKVSLPFFTENEKGVFQKKVYVMRLPLAEKNNLPLKSASYSKDLFKDSTFIAKGQGLINALIEGIKCGKIMAICPDSLEYRYTYQRLQNELSHIEKAVVVEVSENYFPLQEFALAEEKEPISTENTSKNEWIALNNVVDIVVEKGFMSSDSRPYFRILYFRLVWHNPEISPRPRNLALIPYSFAAPYLAEVYVKLENETQMSVLNYFAAELFLGHIISTE